MELIPEIAIFLPFSHLNQVRSVGLIVLHWKVLNTGSKRDWDFFTFSGSRYMTTSRSHLSLEFFQNGGGRFIKMKTVVNKLLFRRWRVQESKSQREKEECDKVKCSLATNH